MSNTNDENGAVSIVTTTSQANNSVDRRKTLKKLGIGGVLVTGAKWTSPVVMAVTLPVHAQTSATTTTTPAPGTTTTTTTTTTPMPCSMTQVCAASAEAELNGFAGGFSFNEQSCDMRIGPGAFDFIIDVNPDTVFRIDNNSGGQFLIPTTQTAWSVNGISFPYTLIGSNPVTGPASEDVTFNITNNSTDNQYQIFVRVTRDVGPQAINMASWLARVSTLCT